MRRLMYVALVGMVFIGSSSFAAGVYTGFNNKIVLAGDTAKKDSVASDSTDDDDDLDRMFSFGLEYASDQAQHGLHNDIKIPYLEPNFTYTSPKGFYIELSDQYVLAKKIAGFDAFCVTPGWDIDFGDNTTLNFNYTHYTFSGNSSNLIKSSLSNSLETYVDQWLGNLRGKFSVDYEIYKQKASPNDVMFTPDLMYKFKWKLGSKTAIKFKPEVSVDLGTRNFYTEYLIAEQADSVAKKQKQKVKTIPSNANATFGTLDYNITLPIVFVVGKFDFEPAFNYTDPLYKPSNIPNSAIAYFTFSITYTISTK